MKANSPPEKQNRAARYLSGSAAIHFLAICILALVCGLVFVNALSNSFVFDDYAVIVENKYIKDAGGSIAAFFNRSYYKIAGGEASYRPVATLSYYLIHAAAGLDPFYYHIVSLGLHILNAVLVYWLIYCVLKNPLCAWIGGLLFACHGAQKLFGVLGGKVSLSDPLMATAGIIEFLGGILIILGLFAGYAAFLASGLMAAAYFMAHAPQSFWPITNNGELAVLYCFAFFYVAFRGSGRFSIDALIKSKPKP